MSAIIEVLSDIFTLVFVVGSMLALGLSLTMQQITAPLRDVNMVVRVLLANFVLVPLLAYLINLLIPMDEPFSIGLILLATAAGAPFLPKLVQMAKGDIAMGVGLMVLLMVTTVIYVPLVLPLLLTGVSVDPLAIASSLVVLMLMPLGIGLFIKACYPETAADLQPTFAQASNFGLIGLIATMLLLNWRTILGTIGSGAILGALIFIAISFVIGYLLAPNAESRSVLGLGTAQRNIAAAMVVAGDNFTDPNVLIMVLVGAVLMMVLLLPGAGELGKRQSSKAIRQTANAA
ncbi:MAG: bile acid:sodium symporter [Anaerolineae bacterium]|nr:bile acid:sodium symporter [Anaerolineae bacterium]